MGHLCGQQAIADCLSVTVSLVLLLVTALCGQTWASWLWGQVTAGCSVLFGTVSSGGGLPHPLRSLGCSCPPTTLCDHFGHLASFVSWAPTSLVAGLED